MTITRKTRITFTLIAVYLVLKILTTASFVSPVIRVSIFAFLRGLFTLGLLGIFSYTTYMVIRRRENIWILFFVIWGIICFFMVPINVRLMIDYAKEAIVLAKPAEKASEAVGEIAELHNRIELDTFVAAATHPVAVKVSAPWCGPCQAMKPHYEKLAGELGSKIGFAEINFDTFADKDMLSVKGIPLIICYKNGKEAFRITGYKDKGVLRHELSKLTQ